MDHVKSQEEKTKGCCGGCKNAANGSCKSIAISFDLGPSDAGRVTPGAGRDAAVPTRRTLS